MAPLGCDPMLTTPLAAPGYPAPRLYWFKDGQPLAASARIRMVDKKTLHTLEVLSVTSEDAGQYSAYVSNAVGAAYSSARLLVRGGCWSRCQPTHCPMAGLRWARGHHPIYRSVVGGQMPVWVVEGAGCRSGRLPSGPPHPHPKSRPAGPGGRHLLTVSLISLPFSGPSDPEEKPAAGELSPDGLTESRRPSKGDVGLDTGFGEATQPGGGWDLGGRTEPTHDTGLWFSACRHWPPVSPQMFSSSWRHPDSWRSSPPRR